MATTRGYTRWHGSIAAALVASLAVACGQAAEPSSVIVYEGARLIVGDGTVIENAAFAVDGGRFVGVGAAGGVPAPDGAARVNLAGKTVMPAIVDTHVHLNTTRDALLADLRRRAYFGVGAAMSMGSDPDDVPLAVRTEVLPGLARFRSAGNGITRPEPGRRVVHWVNTEDEARKAVQVEAARHVDMIKIWVDDRDGQYEKLTPALYGAVIDEAHANGLRVAAHIFTLADAKGLLHAGIDVFAHGVRDRDVDDEFVGLAKAHPGVVLIPNLPARGVAADLGWLSGVVPADQLPAGASADDPKAREAFGIQARNLVKLRDAGTTIALGTDGNTPWEAHVEMEDMVAAGMTPAEVIVAATRNGAALLRLDDMGTIATGKSADFVVLDANPLDDITNTRRIASVYLRGDAVDRAGFSW